MGAQSEDYAAENKYLRRCINDLLSVLTLPALWSGNEPAHVTQTLADTLVSMLDLDFLYIRLSDPNGDSPIENVRVAESAQFALSPQKVRALIPGILESSQNKPPRIPNPAGDGDLGIAVLQLGLRGETGVIAAGSQRATFPQATENLVLSVAANQASIGLQEARLLKQQKRLASELDHRVALRTAELATANEELRKEVAERKKIEERLIESETLLLEAQRLSHTGSWKHDFGSNTVAISPEMARIFEMPSEADAMTAEFFFSRIHPEDGPMQATSYETAIREKREFESEYRIRFLDGSIKHIHNIGHPKLNQSGEVVGFVGTAIDVTQRRTSEEALATARSELAKVARVTSLGVLTAAMAHEVNQPLSGIMTNASTCMRMLSAEQPNVEGARETARRTIRDANRASDVITRLRTLYSKKDPSLELMNLNEAAREVASLCRNELQRNEVILREELAEDLPLVMGDRIQLQQVILNLLRNGSDAMSAMNDRPRDLLIVTKRDEVNLVRLSVKDAGIGFEPQAADRLFLAFYTTKNDGMGIGLSISQSIIEAHQGRLWATPNDGPGATFSFAIPCRPESASEMESSTDRTKLATDAG